MPSDLKDLIYRIGLLRKDCREHMGGLTWKPVTKQFGLYTANAPDLEAFINHAEHHFVELERLFEAYAESQATRPGGD